MAMTYGLNLPALAMSGIAGLSTSIGGLAVIWAGAPSESKLGSTVGFAAGVMLYISFMHLLAESIESIGMFAANLSFFAGVLLFDLISRLVPEGDFGELANMTDHKKTDGDNKGTGITRGELMRTALLTALGVSIHNLPEGMCVYLSCLEGINRSIPLIFAIAIHNIPEGMTVAAPIYHSTGSKWETMKWTTISGLCEPLGAALFGLVLAPVLAPQVISGMLAGVAGIMVQVVLVELLPTALKCAKKESVATSAVVGMVVIFVTLWISHDVLQVEV